MVKASWVPVKNHGRKVKQSLMINKDRDGPESYFKVSLNIN